jgi:hypothetical protein
MSQTFGPPPWHLWGNSSENLALDADILGSTGKSAQLARIAYKRPETWHFAFELVALSMTQPTNDFVLDVFFDIVIGVGRSKISIDSFEHFTLSSAGGPPGLVSPFRMWSTQVISPGRIQSVNGPSFPGTNPGICDHIVAQDIQCNARAIFLGPPTNTIQLEVTALFAPKTHIRPEWFMQKFPGGEDY